MGDLCNFLELIINGPNRKNCLPKTGSASRAVWIFIYALDNKDNDGVPGTFMWDSAKGGVTTATGVFLSTLYQKYGILLRSTGGGQCC